ncbi:glycosyltransferase [Flavobacteriaceae bacterium]|nr:glycosyltransferase [Flavobacteriaceae bacterium]
MPKISVLLSAYNAQNHIEETIRSVLNQTFTNFEFIIIDDGSTDKTKEIIDKFNDVRIKYFHFENAGLSKSLNRGLKISTGNYIARIDADDICYPERLEKQYKFMEENPSYVVCGSYTDVISQDGEFIFTSSDVPLSDSEIRNIINKKNCFYHPTTFYRREQALEIGGYYEPIKQYFEDYMFFFQLIKLGKAFNIAEPLIKYRLTPGSISSVRYNWKYKSLIKKVVVRGFITNEEKKYLYSLKKKKITEKTIMSDYYLNIARYFLTYQSNFEKFKYYYILSLKSNPFNLKIIIHILYMFYVYIFKKRKPTAIL